MKSSIQSIVLVLFVLATLFSTAQSTDQTKPAVIEINDALSKGMLDLRITGASVPGIFFELLDGDGLHFGKCMAIDLRSKIDTLVLLKLECGTELIPDDSTFQTMIVTKSVEFPLYPRQIYNTRFYAMCGQIHDAPPYSKSTYQVGQLADSNVVRIATYLENNFIQGIPGQHALWACTDNVDFSELETYGADSLSIAKSKEILYNLSIVTALSPKLPEALSYQEVLVDSDSIQVNKLLVYCTGALVMVLLITSTVLFFKWRSKVYKAVQ